MTLLEKCKLTLRVSGDDFDEEIEDIINAGLKDLDIAGVLNAESETTDPLIIQAVKTYVRIHFGDTNGVEERDRLKASYDEQKAQLQMASGYTDWLR